MVTKHQMTGMKGVYLVAAELAGLGFIASPTSRSAQGADILVTDKKCKRAYSVQVKTNSRYTNFWLAGKKSVSKSHIYVFVNLDKPRKEKNSEKEEPEYFIVPSKKVKIGISKRKTSTWYSVYRDDIKSYKNKWSKAFGKP